MNIKANKEINQMIIVMGFDKNHKARAIEVEDTNREKIEEMLKIKGWTNLIFFER